MFLYICICEQYVCIFIILHGICACLYMYVYRGFVADAVQMVYRRLDVTLTHTPLYALG